MKTMTAATLGLCMLLGCEGATQRPSTGGAAPSAAPAHSQASAKPPASAPVRAPASGKAASAPAASSVPAADAAPAPARSSLISERFKMTGKGTLAEPVMVPKASVSPTVDGDAAEWEGVPSVPAPFMNVDTSSVKLCWTADGLFGCVSVTDGNISANVDSPWKGDAVELFVERGAAREDNMHDHASQLIVMPSGPAADGDVWVSPDGAAPAEGQLKAAWRKTDGGYVVEFFMDAKWLGASPWQKGAWAGLNVSIDDDGRAVEQLFVDKDDGQAFKHPARWGVIELDE